MVFTQNPIPTFVKQPSNGKVTSNNTTNTVAYTAGSNGSKIIGISATTNSAAALSCSIQILSGGTLYLIGTGSIPANAGANTTTAGVDLLASVPGLPRDNDNNDYFMLTSGDQLQITLGAAIASPNVATIFVNAGDF